MMKAALYFGLDTLATVLEICMLYVCMIIFCKRRVKKGWEALPYLTIVFLTIVMTWVIPLGLPKIMINAMTFLILQRLILKEKWHKMVASYFLSVMIWMMTDLISLIAVAAAFGHTSILVGDVVVNIWQFFFLKMSMLAVMIFTLYKVLGNYDAETSPRDAVLLFLCTIFTFTAINSFGAGFFVGDVNWFDSTVAISCALFGMLLLLFFLYQKNNRYLKSQRELAQQRVWELEQKHAYYEEKLKDEERVRAVYHDMKNHLLLMEQQGNHAPLQQMAESLQKQISDFESYYHTGNEFLDVIIRDKAKKAKEQQIDFGAVIRFEYGKFIAPLDISTIFGNALDNALEASMKLPSDRRLITVKADKIHDMLVIVFQNYMLPEKDSGRNATKEDAFLHGFGLKNIRQAVEKYEGECTVWQEQGAFVLKIIIPIP